MKLPRLTKRAPNKRPPSVVVRDVAAPKNGTFLDLRTNARERVRFIEFHFEALLPFMREHRRPLSIIAIALLVLSSFGFFGRSRATVATFHPSSCLGGWQHPSNAIGVPSLSPDDSLEKFNSANSAVLGNSSAEIYCGAFTGEIPEDSQVKSFELSFVWSVDNGSVAHPEPTPFDALVSAPAPDPVIETPAPAEVKEEGVNADAPLPPADAESVDVAPPSSSEEPQSLLDMFKPATVFAQESAVEVEQAATSASADEPEVTIPAPAEEQESVTPAPADEVAAPSEAPVSDAPAPSFDAFASVAYTLDGEHWNPLGDVGLTSWRQARFTLPLRAWDDLSKVQISITPIQTLDRQPVVYLDAVEISVDYENGAKKGKPTVVIRNAEAAVIEGDTDFASDVAPSFAVVDPHLSVADISSLVRENKAEIVHDADGVLAEKVTSDPEPVSWPAAPSGTDRLLDGLKGLFTSTAESPAAPAEVPAVENVTETQTEVSPSSEVPSEATPTDPTPVEVIEGPAELPASSHDAPAATPSSDAPVSFWRRLFAPATAHAAGGLFDDAPRIVSARVLDWYGNPTSIGAKIETVTVHGETREGVTLEKPKRAFRAGRYTLEVTVETLDAIIISEQDFTWGVLAVNTDKATYGEGEEAYLSFGVLDEKGNTICGADLDLVITSPLGGTQHFTTDDESIVREAKCGRNNIIDVPDYYAHYMIPAESGTYLMTLTGVTENGTKTITDTFDVGSPRFDVVRTGPTRIFPPSSYPMTLRVTAHEDWSGVVTELVPAGFAVMQPKRSQEFDSVSTSGDVTTVTWHVDLKAGEEAVLGYNFKAPDISPQFYLLGPLSFYESDADADAGTSPVFRETREWQLAADAVCTAASSGPWNTSGTWSCGHVPTNSDSVTINSGATVTMDVNSATSIQGVTINGTLNTATSGTSYDLTTTTLTIGATGTLTANASTITFTGTSGTLFTLTGGGTFTQGTSEVVVTSASGTPTLLSAATTFHRLKINSAATVINAGAAITMSSANSANRLYVQAGVLNDGGNQITGTANGTLIVDAGAALCIGGTANATNATCDSGATPTTATSFPTNYTNGNITLNSGVLTSGWYNVSWGYRTKITIDHTKVSGTQTDFPVLISKTDNRFRTVANSGHMGNSTGTDLLVTASDGTTKLNHELERYVASTGEILVWVKVPSLSSTVDTDLYIYYGNAGAADQQNVSGTWNSAYKQVLHVPDGTTLSTTDSTTNAYNGTNNGGAATSGVVDGGVVFNTLGNRIDNSNGLYTMVGGAAAHTESAWVRVDNPAFGSGTNYFWDGDNTNGGGNFANIGNGSQIQWGYGGFGTFRDYALTTTLSVGTWAYITMVKSASGDNGALYINGVLQTSYTGTLGDLASGTTTSHWGNYHGSGASTLQGAMDEMRISNTNRSAGWIVTEYNGMNSPSTFIPTYATEEAVSTADSIVYYNADAATTVSSTPTYAALKISPVLTAARTYTFGSGSTAINGNFTINPVRSSSALLTVNMGGNITVASTKTTTITRTTSATSTLVTRPSGTDYNLSTGLLVIGAGATLDASGSASVITLTSVSGTLITNGGTFTQGNSNVTVASATGPVALLSATQTFHILTINSASASTVVNAGAAITIEDTSGAALVVTSGVLNDSGLGYATSGSSANALTLGASGTLCLGGASGANAATTCDTSATSTTSRVIPSFASYSLNATSTVIYLSNAATTVSSVAYGHLKLLPVLTTTRTYTLPGSALSVSGNFDIKPSASAGSAGLTVNAAANITVTGTTTIQPGTTNSPTASLSLRPSGTDYALTTGKVDIEANGTLTCASTSYTGTITLTGTSGTLFTNAGTFTQGNSTVAVTSASGSPTLLSAGTTFHILKIATSGGSTIVNAGAAVTTDNTALNKLWIASGVFNQEGRTITAGTAGTLQIDSGATLCLGGTTASTAVTCDSGATQTSAQALPSFSTYTFDAASTVTFLSNADTTISSTPTYGTLKFAPVLTASRAYTFAGAMTVNGDLTLNPNSAGSFVLTANMAGTVTVASGKTTTISRQGSTATAVLDVRPSSTDYDLSTGFLAISTGGTLDGTSASSTITLTGTSGTLFTRTGTFTQGTTEVTVASASGSPTLLSAATTFHKLKINAAATVINAGAAVTMSSTSAANRLYVQSGVFNDGGNQITGTSNGTLIVDTGATLCIGGTANATNATCDSGATPTTATTFPTNYTSGNISLYSSASAAAWYSGSWGYRMAITIDHTKVPSTQTNFAVLVSATNAAWKHTGSGGHMGKTDATDMLFTASDGTTKLDHEIEFYVSTTGELIAWVRVPSLSSSADTVLYAYYGNAGASDQQNVASTWDSRYRGVWHYKNGTTLSVADSLGLNNGTIVGSMSAVSGKVDGAAHQDNSSAGVTYSGITATATHTVSGWVKLDSLTAYGNLLAQSAASGYWFHFGKLDLYTTGDFDATTAVTAGVWSYFAATYDGTTVRYYLNGATNGTGNTPGFTFTPNGSFKDNGGADPLAGALDELRYSAAVRSADWVTTQYNNQSSPSAFLSIGSEITSGASSSTVYYNADAATTVSSTPTYADLKFHPVLTAARAYTLASGTFTVNGDWSINPNSSGSNLLTVNAGGTMNVPYGSVTVARQGSTASSALDLRPSSTDYDLTTLRLTVSAGGTLDGTGASSTITLTGTTGTLFTFGGTFNVGTTTVSVTGNGSVTLNSGAGTFYNLTQNATGTKTLGGNITIDPAATLTLTLGTLDTASGSNYQISAGHISIANSASAILNANASAIALTGTSGTLLTRGASGAWNAGTSVVTLSGNGSATLNSAAATGTNKFYDLISSGTGTKTLGAAIEVSDIFGVTGGTFDTSGSNYAVTTASLSIGASGTLKANGSTITDTGNWSNSGTFTANTSTVLFNTGSTAAVSGTTSFYDLTITHSAAKEVDFAASGGTPTYTVSHTFTVTGHSGALIKLRSASTGTKWDFLPSGTAAVDYVDVKDGGCHTGAISLSPTNYTNSGNNDSCWSNAVAPTLTFSISSPTVAFGALSTAGSGSGSHTISVASNAGAGFALTYSGATLTRSGGTDTIAGYATPSASTPGTAGFGLNLVDTAITTNSGTCAAATNYATTSLYAFLAGTTTTVTNVTAPADCVFTATYKANVSSVTPAGSYSTAITYIATGTF